MQGENAGRKKTKPQSIEDAELKVAEEAIPACRLFVPSPSPPLICRRAFLGCLIGAAEEEPFLHAPGKARNRMAAEMMPEEKKKMEKEIRTEKEVLAPFLSLPASSCFLPAGMLRIFFLHVYG